MALMGCAHAFEEFFIRRNMLKDIYLRDGDSDFWKASSI